MHNFDKYVVPHFNKISSIELKLDTKNKFYKDFKNLDAVKSQNKEKEQKKITLLKNASLFYNELVSMYKKEYEI